MDRGAGSAGVTACPRDKEPIRLQLCWLGWTRAGGAPAVPGQWATFQTMLREELMTSEKINEDKSRKVVKVVVIVFSIIELVVMVAIFYSRKG